MTLRGNSLWLGIGLCIFAIHWGLFYSLVFTIAITSIISTLTYAIVKCCIIDPDPRRCPPSAQKSQISVKNGGLPTVLEKVEDLAKDSSNKANDDGVVSGIDIVDVELNLVLDYLLRDFVIPWSSKLACSEDIHEIDDSLKIKLRTTIGNFTTPLLTIDWVDYFTSQLVDDFSTHLRLYR